MTGTALSAPGLAALACLAVALAGCASDDPRPPNADPAGPTPDQPDPTPTNTTGPNTGTGSFSVSTTSSASGTTSPQPVPGVQLAGDDQEDVAQDGDFPGLMAAGRLEVSGGIAHLEGSANNFGERTYKVSSICVQPWSEAMQGPSGTAQHRQPVATCAAFGLREFPPGESLPFSATWNGTLWTEDGYAPAPAGTYTWSATFHVYSGGEGASYDDDARLTLEFQVTVG